jgi:hypothetical protein
MLRFICQSCGVKWFVPPGSPQPVPDACGACQGSLTVLPDDRPCDDGGFVDAAAS